MGGIRTFVSEYFGLNDELDKKEIFDCILDKDSPFFINLMQLKVCDILEFQGSYHVEGCSGKTVKYYDSTLRNTVSSIGKAIAKITTDDLRIYLDNYEESIGISKVTIDNIRRILSSFFSWLEDEDYIVKSPVRRIHKVKTCKTVKETYSDEALELIDDQ